MVDAAGAGICPRLAALLPPDSRPSDSEAHEVSYVLVPSEDAALGTYAVRRDGAVCFRAETADDAVNWLSREIDSAIAVHARAGLFVHAGVVAWRGRAIVVPGRSTTGKSTLVAELVRRGATYYSDEFAVLDDEARVHPYARPPVLRGAVHQGRPAGNMAREIAERPALPVSLIVSMPFREGATWCPKVITGARAVLPIIDNTILARAESARTVRLAARMAPHVVTLEGVRPDAEVAAPRILEVLDDLIDGQPARTGGPRVLERAGELRARAAQKSAQIARAKFVVLNEVLEPDEHARLLQYAREHERDFATSGVMAADGTSRVDPTFRKSGTIFHVDDMLRPLEIRLRRLLPHVRRELGVPWFPLGRMELQLAARQEGGFFGAHTDDGRTEVAGRRLTCVYYMHGTPRRFSGGQLLIHDTEVRDGCPVAAGAHVWVEPVDNSAVFFPSSLLHEVRPVHRETDAFEDSRFSVNVWFWVGSSPLPAPADTSPRSAA
jgi:Rps23 Pro-64 3,4-dihydroxylase Tpa1-like proline 4-hydroxylase